MSLQEQARKFREVFKQETLDNISQFGFIKKAAVGYASGPY